MKRNDRDADSPVSYTDDGTSEGKPIPLVKSALVLAVCSTTEFSWKIACEDLPCRCVSDSQTRFHIAIATVRSPGWR